MHMLEKFSHGVSTTIVLIGYYALVHTNLVYFSQMAFGKSLLGLVVPLAALSAIAFAIIYLKSNTDLVDALNKFYTDGFDFNKYHLFKIIFAVIGAVAAYFLYFEFLEHMSVLFSANHLVLQVFAVILTIATVGFFAQRGSHFVDVIKDQLTAAGNEENKVTPFSFIYNLVLFASLGVLTFQFFIVVPSILIQVSGILAGLCLVYKFYQEIKKAKKENYRNPIWESSKAVLFTIALPIHCFGEAMIAARGAKLQGMVISGVIIVAIIKSLVEYGVDYVHHGFSNNRCDHSHMSKALTFCGLIAAFSIGVVAGVEAHVVFGAGLGVIVLFALFSTFAEGDMIIHVLNSSKVKNSSRFNEIKTSFASLYNDLSSALGLEIHQAVKT